MQARAPNAQGRTRNGAVTQFPDYNQKDWHELVRRFYGLVIQHCGAEAAAEFRVRLGHNAAEYLWMIPKYDHGHIAVMRKPSSHHNAETRREIQSLSQLEKTTWLAASFAPESIWARSLEAVNQHFRLRKPAEEARYRLSPERLEIGQGHIRSTGPQTRSHNGLGKQHRNGPAVARCRPPTRALVWHGSAPYPEEIALQVESRAEAVMDDDVSSEDSEGSPVAPFDDGEGSGFLFDGNDGQGTSNQEPAEDEDTVVVDMSPLRRREPAQPVWPVRPIRVPLPRRQLLWPHLTMARVEDFRSTGMMTTIPATKSLARTRTAFRSMHRHFAAGSPPSPPRR